MVDEGLAAIPMGFLDKTRFFYRRLLANDEQAQGDSTGANEATPDTGPDEAELPAVEADATLPMQDEEDGFGDLLSGLGAEVSEPGEDNALALKDATIEALQGQLLDLQRLGDELAATERARLAALETIAELQRELSDARDRIEELETAESSTSTEGQDELRAKIDRLRERLREREAISRRHYERLEKLRVRFDERDRVASERWHLIHALTKEKRELEEALEKLRDQGEGTAEAA